VSDELQHKFIGVIDDEQDLATLFTEALKQLEGYSVFGFTDPRLALKHLTANKSNYALLLSDQRLIHYCVTHLVPRLGFYNLNTE
jgi:DNA-binding NtrC family response regulator